jgi:hypothetical protein
MAAPTGEKAEFPRIPMRSPEFCRPVGDKLKVLFGDLARDPMPDRLRELAEALEVAMQRGELGRRKPS